ncbi:MAG: hypothetical protein IH983_08005 [Planctomycetes bacterium]|nr:hypothetical protein [Planctomycetota bacterium]
MSGGRRWATLPGATVATMQAGSRARRAAQRLESLRKRQGGKMVQRKLWIDTDTLEMASELVQELGGGLSRRAVIRIAIVRLLERLAAEGGP